MNQSPLAASPRTPHHVVMVGFEDAQILDITGPLEVFARTSRWLREHARLAIDAYTVELVAHEAGPLRTSGGLQLIASRTYRDVRDARKDVRDSKREYRQDARDWRRDARYQNYRAPFKYQQFRVGQTLRSTYYAPAYRPTWDSRWGVPRAGRGLTYVRHYNDLLLVNVRTGKVVKVYRNEFRWR